MTKCKHCKKNYPVDGYMTYFVKLIDRQVEMCKDCYKKHQNQQNKVLDDIKADGKPHPKAKEYRLEDKDF